MPRARTTRSATTSARIEPRAPSDACNNGYGLSNLQWASHGFASGMGCKVVRRGRRAGERSGLPSARSCPRGGHGPGAGSSGRPARGSSLCGRHR
eukprot:15445877-Alexandrium_andersonii.AAC.1